MTDKFVPIPDVFHIGIPKAGSTSIQYVLGQDARVQLTRGRYFTSSDWWTAERASRSASDKLVVESNETLVSGGFQKVKFIQVVERMYRTNPSARVIVVMREQRSAILSMYKYHIRNAFYGIGSLENWLFRTDLGMDYLSLCLYGNLARALTAYFPKSQVRFIPFELMKDNAVDFYDRLYEFLGLPYDHTEVPKSNKNPFSDDQLYTLTRLNNFAIFSRRSENPRFSTQGYKLEQRIKKGLVRRLSLKSPEDFFDLDGVNGADRLFDDFRTSNRELMSIVDSNTPDLQAHGYLT